VDKTLGGLNKTAGITGVKNLGGLSEAVRENMTSLRPIVGSFGVIEGSATWIVSAHPVIETSLRPSVTAPRGIPVSSQAEARPAG